MKLCYLPSIYNHELFYSYVARYHHQTANIHTTQTLAEFFDSTDIETTIDLPIRLTEIENRTYLKANNIIDNNTLFFYLTAFKGHIINDLKRKMLCDTALRYLS